MCRFVGEVFSSLLPFPRNFYRNFLSAVLRGRCGRQRGQATSKPAHNHPKIVFCHCTYALPSEYNFNQLKTWIIFINECGLCNIFFSCFVSCHAFCLLRSRVMAQTSCRTWSCVRRVMKVIVLSYLKLLVTICTVRQGVDGYRKGWQRAPNSQATGPRKWRTGSDIQVDWIIYIYLLNTDNNRQLNRIGLNTFFVFRPQTKKYFCRLIDDRDRREPVRESQWRTFL